MKVKQNKQSVSLTHPAIVAHLRGDTVTFQVGNDHTIYLYTCPRTGSEYLISEWDNGDIGVQKI